MEKKREDNDDDNENDVEFLDYFERLSPKCQSLKTIVESQVKEVLSKIQREPLKNEAPGDHEKSLSYLERQNSQLLNLLLKSGKSELTQGELGVKSDVKPLGNSGDKEDPGPLEAVARKRVQGKTAFWK